MADTLFENFKKYAVCAESLSEFCETWHKPGILTAFNREDDYKGHKADMEKYGYTIIPASSSATGRIVSYYGKV